MAAELESIRIDKWLWAARFFKTRSIAQEAVELGRVRLNDQRLKPSREVKPGDRLTVERGDERFDIFVEKISTVRGPAPVAQTLYRETDESKKNACGLAKCERLRWNRRPPSPRAVPPSAMRV